MIRRLNRFNDHFKSPRQTIGRYGSFALVNFASDLSNLAGGRWVASENIEDYTQRFRKWPEWRVANTVLGAASFMLLFVIGATLLVQCTA